MATTLKADDASTMASRQKGACPAGRHECMHYIAVRVVSMRTKEVLIKVQSV